ncbi:MAG: hypothetical protein V4710_05660 [Verrucomicrobiota bacterium]
MKLHREQFSDPELKKSLLADVRRDLRRKRRTKIAIREERSDPGLPYAPIAPGLIPIERFEAASCVHYPLGEDDLRSLVEALPAAATEGISRIRLVPGKEYIEECNAGSREDRDPFIGRLGWEIFHGVYAGDVLGTYNPGSGSIELYAYVYNPAFVGKLPQPALSAYLRLHALKTFIHEVAHHHDHRERVGRRRWLADRTATGENYAECMEYEWTRQIGIGWLEQRFPEETKALQDWLEEFGGYRTPLAFLAGNPRTTCRNGLQNFAFSSSYAFESFVTELARSGVRRGCPQRRLLFAQ